MTDPGDVKGIGIAGATSTVAAAFVKLLPPGYRPVLERLAELQPGLDRYLICTGYLAGKRLGELSPDEVDLTWRRNFIEPARFCDLALAANPRTRICLLGSMSGIRGSYDAAYAGAKAALHLYVETTRLTRQDQQLVCIAPGIIGDSAMTEARTDRAALGAREAATRRGRWLKATEVAEMAYQALFAAPPILSNTIIRMDPEV